jgi:hypothetical protein
MRKSTLLMVGILAAVAMLSAGLAVAPTTMQQANANFMEDGDGGDTDFSFEQDHSNRCSGFAGCSNADSIIFGFPDM